jgi:hypothetical protein
MRCRVCGREVDPRGFQVVVPGLGIGFDRVDCALEASSGGVPLVATPPPLPIAARPPALALPTVAMAGGTAASASAAATATPTLLVGANVAFLAAGAAATVYLWLRVFSPDAAVMRAPVEHAAAAFARSTVSAGIDLTRDSAVRPQPETVAFGGGPGATATAVGGYETAAVSKSGRATTSPSTPSEADPAAAKGGGSGGPVARPTPPPAPPPPPQPAPSPPRQTPAPVPPVPTSPPEDRVPGPTLPGPGLPDSGPSLVGGGTPPGS